MNQAAALDADELLHLALYATEHDTPDTAIAHLKQLLALDPNHAQGLYLLGALHAEIGLYDKAKAEMAQALALDANLPATARFQLGLLHITSGEVDKAQAVWQALDNLGEQDALYQFKTGMLHLVKDEFERCATALRAGLALNTLNKDLNSDMQRVLQDAEAAAGKAAVADNTPQTLNAGDGQRMLLSIYERQDDDGS